MTADSEHAGPLRIHLEPGQRLGPARVPGADLVLRVRSGDVVVEVTPGIETGDVVAVPAGTAFVIRAGDTGASVEVTARPPGPERFLELASRHPAPPLAALVSAAVEQGVELLPAGLHAADGTGEAAR